LQEATVRGIRWLAVMRVVSEAIGLASMVALARLVTPAEFGHAAIALIFITVGVILTFEGFSSALVQRPEISKADRSAAMLMSILGGIVLSAIVYLLAGPLWAPLFGVKTASLIKLVAPTLFISALGGVSRATIWRRLDFRTVSSIDAISMLGGSIAAVALALAGDGATAIVLGSAIQTTLTTVLLMVVAPPPFPRASRSSQREISAFGIPSALAGMAGVAFQNVDYAVLAARLPAATVGLYYRAFNVSVVYQDKLSKIMLQIAFPVYARTESREHLRAFHERVARVHALIIFPFLATIAALAPILIPLVFGPAWRGAVHPTEILAVAGCCAAVLTGYSQVMLAIGRPRPLLYFNIAMVVVYGWGVLLASHQGLIVIACTVSAMYLLILLGVYHFLLRPNVGLSIRRLIPELGPAVAGCAALVALDILLRVRLAGLPDIVIAMVAGPAGLITYALVVRYLFPSAWNDLVTLITRVLPPAARWVRPRRVRTREQDEEAIPVSAVTPWSDPPTAAALATDLVFTPNGRKFHVRMPEQSTTAKPGRAVADASAPDQTSPAVARG
ncbi:MAG: lipopolysaccharide biosynthesis protein, partial [Solirubrobacteraceae bacterium]